MDNVGVWSFAVIILIFTQKGVTHKHNLIVTDVNMHTLLLLCTHNTFDRENLNF